MCSANGLAAAQHVQSVFLNTESNVRFAMKLPRYNGNTVRKSQSVSVAARAARPPGIQEPSNNHRQNGNTVRKSQSASVALAPARAAGPRGIQEPSNNLRRTPSLPIPAQAKGPNGRSSLSRSAEKSDLTRMYDYATWNMYERIVSARKKRLPNQVRQAESTHHAESSGVSGHAACESGKAVASVKSSAPIRSVPLVSKTQRQDERTADETDKSSLGSSFSNSPSHAFPLCTSPPEGGNEESFIFPLDM